ncbi:MAG: hypothetical protein PF689_13255 [Deltaproteobacteria bacterium]|jgi:hypothetical protein|nr:hypothetical protein [Deltaproteobacteria bacterium]
MSTLINNKTQNLPKRLISKFDAGVLLGGFTLWFASLGSLSVEPAFLWSLLLLPWLAFKLKLSFFVRTVIWPVIITIMILLNRQPNWFQVLTLFFLTLAYYFFVLEERYQTKEIKLEKIEIKNKQKKIYPFLFFFFSLSLLLVEYFSFSRYQAFVLLYTAFILSSLFNLLKVADKISGKKLKVLAFFSLFLLLSILFSSYYQKTNYLVSSLISLFFLATGINLIATRTPKSN